MDVVVFTIIRSKERDYLNRRTGFLRVLAVCFASLFFVLPANAEYDCDRCYTACIASHPCATDGSTRRFLHAGSTCPTGARRVSENTGGPSCNIICECDNSAHGWNGSSCAVQSCAANQYMSGGTCQACPTGTTSPAGSTSLAACRGSCTTACSNPALNATNCPAGRSCTFGTNNNSGTRSCTARSGATCTTWGACDASALACPITVSNCGNGTWNAGGEASCVATHSLCVAGMRSLNGSLSAPSANHWSGANACGEANCGCTTSQTCSRPEIVNNTGTQTRAATCNASTGACTGTWGACTGGTACACPTSQNCVPATACTVDNGTCTWVVNSGTQTRANTCTTGATIGCPAWGACTGYTRNITCNDGWHLSGGVCVRNTFTVNYNGNSSTGGSTTTTHSCTFGLSCSPANAIANPFTRTGYTFTGWNTDSDGSGRSFSAGGALTTNLTVVNGGTVTLFAQWTRVTCLAGHHVGGTNNTECIPCPAGQFQPVINSTATSCTACANGSFATGTGNATCTTCAAATSNTGCRVQRAGGTFTTSIASGATNINQCLYLPPAPTIPTGCVQAIAHESTYNPATGWGECRINVSAPSGRYITGNLTNNPQCPQCALGTWRNGQIWANATCNACPSLPSVNHTHTGTGRSLVTDCRATINAPHFAALCTAGAISRHAINDTTWCAYFVSYALHATQGAIVDGVTCTACLIGQWSPGGTATVCQYCTNQPENAAVWNHSSVGMVTWGCNIHISECIPGFSVYGNNTPTATCGGNLIRVEYSANGGTGFVSGHNCSAATSCLVTSDEFTRTGYLFDGWALGANIYNAGYELLRSDNSIGGAFSGTITLVAQWVPIRYTITFDAASGSGSMAAEEFIFNAVDNLPPIGFDAPTGFGFARWVATDGATGQFIDRSEILNLTTVPNAVIVLTAVWEPCALGWSTAGAWCNIDCPSGWHTSDSGLYCVSSTRTCITSGGEIGTQNWIASDRRFDDCEPIICPGAQVLIGGVCRCPIGYHVYNDTCRADTRTCDVDNGTGEQNWNHTTGDWNACVATDCEFGYHVSAGECVPSRRRVSVDNGYCYQEWDGRRWSACFDIDCAPGWTPDRFETADHISVCGRCRNAFGPFGNDIEPVFSSGCVILSCPLQDILYNLEHNECVPICAIDGADDGTGTMRWNPATHSCEVVCEHGFTHWPEFPGLRLFRP